MELSKIIDIIMHDENQRERLAKWVFKPIEPASPVDVKPEPEFKIFSGIESPKYAMPASDIQISWEDMKYEEYEKAAMSEECREYILNGLTWGEFQKVNSGNMDKTLIVKVLEIMSNYRAIIAQREAESNKQKAQALWIEETNDPVI